jgi:Tol biopolymer transport system component
MLLNQRFIRRWLFSASLTALLAVTALASLSASLHVSRISLLPRGSTAAPESLRDELNRRQKQNGLALISLLWSKVYIVDFAARSLTLTPFLLKDLKFRYGTISPDGAHAAFDSCGGARAQEPPNSEGNCLGRTNLGIANLDGSDLQKDPEIVTPSGICWSPDGSQLALSGGPARGLEVVDRQTAKSQSIEEDNSFFEPQCWSRDGTMIVFTRNRPMKQTVINYELKTKAKREIAAGGRATWIPGTDWITFKDCGVDLQRCTYYATRPDGTNKKVLFKTLTAATGLSWSSDGRLAAYVSGTRPTEVASAPWRLRIWRIDDKSEAWVASLQETDTVFFQWFESAPASAGK